MAGTIEHRYIRAGDLIALLQQVPADTYVYLPMSQAGLGLNRGDDPEPTWDGYLGVINFYSEDLDILPVTPDDEWPAVRDSPIIVGQAR